MLRVLYKQCLIYERYRAIVWQSGEHNTIAHTVIELIVSHDSNHWQTNAVVNQNQSTSSYQLISQRNPNC